MKAPKLSILGRTAVLATIVSGCLPDPTHVAAGQASKAAGARSDDLPFDFMRKLATAKTAKLTAHGFDSKRERWEWRLSREDEASIHNVGGPELSKRGLVSKVIKACGPDMSISTFHLKNGGTVSFAFSGATGTVTVSLSRQKGATAPP